MKFPDYDGINYEKLNEKIIYFEKFKLKYYFNKDITNEEFNSQIKDIIKLIVDEIPINDVVQSVGTNNRQFFCRFK